MIISPTHCSTFVINFVYYHCEFCLMEVTDFYTDNEDSPVMELSSYSPLITSPVDVFVAK